MTPDQLGSLLDDVDEPDLWFARREPELTPTQVGRAREILTELFTLLDDWVDEDDRPNRDERARQALAEAVALVRHGRSRAGRQAIARATDGEPGRKESWLRTLLGDL